MASTSRVRFVWRLPSLLLVALVSRWGYWHCVPHGGDDLAYFDKGLTLLRIGDFQWSWSPVWVSLNAAAELLPVPGLDPRQVLGLGLAVATTAALWWMLRAALSDRVAWLGSLWWAILCGTHVSQYIFHFSMLLWTLACGFVLRRRWLPALAFAALGVVDRLETGLWLLALGAIFVVRGERLSVPPRWRIAFPAVALLLLFGAAADADRAFRARIAFGQHYSLGVEERAGGVLELDGRRVSPWVDWEEIVERRLPGARSTAVAWRLHLGEMVAHTVHNVAALPRSFAAFLLDPYPRTRGLKRVLQAGLALLFGFTIWRNRARVGRVRDCLPPLGWAVTASAAVLLLVPLLLTPRSEFFTIWSAPLVLLVTALLSWGVDESGPGLDRALVAAVTAAVLGMALGSPCPP